MHPDRNDFREELLAADPLPAASRLSLEKELSTMFVRELSTGPRIVVGLVGCVALGSAAVCGALAVTEPDLPLLARIGLGVGTLFGLAWTVMCAKIVRRRAIVGPDQQLIAAMVWVFTVLMMVFFLMLGMTAKDRLLGVLVIVQGLAFLIGAGVYWLTYRIERAELGTREKLLQLELRLAELAEGRR